MTLNVERKKPMSILTLRAAARLFAAGRHLVCGLACCALFGVAGAAQAAVAVDGVAAVVNDAVITVQEFDLRLQQAQRQLQQQKAEMPAAVLARQVLESMISERIIEQRAADIGIRVNDAMLESAIERIAQANQTDIEGLRAKVQADGLDWTDFARQIRLEILQARLREAEIDPQVHVSKVEIDHFLQTRPEAFSGRQYLAAQILLANEESAKNQAAKWQELEKRAADLKRRMAAGERFSALAKRYSDGAEAAQSGLIGWRSAEQLPTLFVEALAGLRPGQVSEPVRSPAGVHLIMLVDMRGGELSQGESTRQTHARHILLKTSELLDDANARSRLQNLRERIVNGEDFAALAKVHSNDMTAIKGGDLGWLTAGDTVPAFERAMNALAVGELGEPVQTLFGWHLIEVLERREHTLDETQKRKLAEQAIARNKARDAFNEWLQEARDSAYVEIRLPDAAAVAP